MKLSCFTNSRRLRESAGGQFGNTLATRCDVQFLRAVVLGTVFKKICWCDCDLRSESRMCTRRLAGTVHMVALETNRLCVVFGTCNVHNCISTLNSSLLASLLLISIQLSLIN